MNSTDFAKTIAARARTRAQMLSPGGRRAAVREHVGTTLERRIERVRHAARSVGNLGGSPSRIRAQVPKT